MNREMESDIVYEDDRVLAFRDIMKQAPEHVLVIPKKHISSLLEAQEEDAALLGHMLLTAKKLAIELGIAESGFRAVFNTGSDGGQSVMHLHLHLMGGRSMGWPPG
jgi:histidine triad (HIT) family protein